MKVKMRRLSAGPAGIRRVGDEVEVSGVEGKELVDGGYADRLQGVQRLKAEQKKTRGRGDAGTRGEEEENTEKKTGGRGDAGTGSGGTGGEVGNAGGTGSPPSRG